MSLGVWLLEDSLGPGDPALRCHPDAPAVFVFDEEWYRANPTSFKRVFFVYESVIETFAGRKAPCEIRRGSVVREVFDFCRKHGLEELHVTRSAADTYRVYVEQLRATLVVAEHAPDELVPWSRRPPHRFMDFWRDVWPLVLPEESGPP